MTFQFLAPWLAWLIIAAAALGGAALFVIRPRPPRRVVSSMIVWRRVLDETRERSWWDRLRWIVSLALTVAIAVAIAAAFARPAPAASPASSGRVLLVLDSSWSMRARTPSGATRWERAIGEAQAVAAMWSGGEVALATTADGVVEGPTTDPALVQDAFGRLRPSGGAEGSWPQVAGVTVVHFFTDGAVARLIPPQVIVHSVFAPVPNVAITAFDVQPSPGPDVAATVFLAVANHAPTPQTVRIAVGRAADVLADRSIDLAPGATHRETLSVPAAGDPRFRARASAPQNDLDIDDEATAWLWTAAPLRVGVVGQDSPISRLLAHDSSLRVIAVEPAEYARATVDLWILDGWLPSEAPTKPALVIDPPASAWLGTRGPEEPQPVWAAGDTHPILEGVDTSLLQVGSARAVIRPTLWPIAMSERETPLVAVEDSRAGRRVVVLFSIADSNLAMTPSFPTFIGNAIDWLGRPDRDLHRQPGPTALPPSTLRVLAPDGRAVPLTRIDDHVSARLEAPGLYLVQSADGQRVLRVTLGDTNRSNLLVSSLAAADSRPSESPRPGRPWWIYATIVAIALAAVEWITWQRRITV